MHELGYEKNIEIFSLSDEGSDCPNEPQFDAQDEPDADKGNYDEPNYPSSFFESQANSMRHYALEVQDKFSEKYSELSSRIKAFIGTIEQAEEHQVDNQYILRGYRINHNSVGSLCKSLFTCHNEFVNVWSHIIGVLVFLTLMWLVCKDVIPHQYWYA